MQRGRSRNFHIIEPNEENAAVLHHAVRLLRDLLSGTPTDSDPVPFRSHSFRINAAEITSRAASPGAGPILERIVIRIPAARVVVQKIEVDPRIRLASSDVTKVLIR